MTVGSETIWFKRTNQLPTSDGISESKKQSIRACLERTCKEILLSLSLPVGTHENCAKPVSDKGVFPEKIDVFEEMNRNQMHSRLQLPTLSEKKRRFRVSWILNEGRHHKFLRVWQLNQSSSPQTFWQKISSSFFHFKDATTILDLYSAPCVSIAKDEKRKFPKNC